MPDTDGGPIEVGRDSSAGATGGGGGPEVPRTGAPLDDLPGQVEGDADSARHPNGDAIEEAGGGSGTALAMDHPRGAAITQTIGGSFQLPPPPEVPSPRRSPSLDESADSCESLKGEKVSSAVEGGGEDGTAILDVIFAPHDVDREALLAEAAAATAEEMAKENRRWITTFQKAASKVTPPARARPALRWARPRRCLGAHVPRRRATGDDPVVHLEASQARSGHGGWGGACCSRPT